MKVKEESEKAGLKLNIQKTKIMASSPITSWQIDGETIETVTGFIFLGPKITVDGDCSHEIKTRLLLGRKAMTNLDSIPKSRDINFAKRGRSSQSSGFSSLHVWMWELSMYGCERKPSAKELMLLNCGCWRRLESPLDCKEIKPVNSKGNQSWICWSWNSQYFGHLMRRTDPLGKILMLGKIAGGRRRGQQRIRWMASPTWWTWVWASSGVGDGQGSLPCCSLWGHKELDTTEWLNWTNSRLSLA